MWQLIRRADALCAAFDDVRERGDEMNVLGSLAATGWVRSRMARGSLALLLGVALAVSLAGPAFGQPAERGAGVVAAEPDPYVLDEYWNQWWWPTYKPTIYAVGPDITIDENGYVYAPFQFGRTGTHQRPGRDEGRSRRAHRRAMGDAGLG